MKSGQKIAIIGGGIAAAIIIAVVVLTSTSISQQQNTQSTISPVSPSSTSKIQIVAAENFWGSLISQLGGTHVQVLSIVSDPNADPHEYESNNADAQAIATANFVIVNGAGYDDWAIKIIAASNNPNQKVLNVADLIGKKMVTILISGMILFM